MKMDLRAAALAATLLLATSGLALAQGTPPVSDPTAGAAETPQQKGKNAQKTAPKDTQTQTTGTGSGAGQTNPPTPSPSSKAPSLHNHETGVPFRHPIGRFRRNRPMATPPTRRDANYLTVPPAEHCRSPHYLAARVDIRTGERQ